MRSGMWGREWLTGWPAFFVWAASLGCSVSDEGTAGHDGGSSVPTLSDAGPRDSSGSSADSSAAADASSATASCGCNGKAGCAVWDNVYISYYGFNDNSCATEGQHGCNDIAYPAPQSTSKTHPNAANIKHTEATEGTGTYDDPITAASSADTDPENPTAANPRHAFESSGGATLSPGTLIYNPEVKKYFIMEDSCIECGDEYACKISPEDTDDGTVPKGCVPGSNLHIDFWMGPETSSDANDLETCEDDSTVGNDWTGGGGQVVVNPPDNLPVVTTKLYTGIGSGGGCWTSTQRGKAACN